MTWKTKLIMLIAGIMTLAGCDSVDVEMNSNSTDSADSDSDSDTNPSTGNNPYNDAEYDSYSPSLGGFSGVDLIVVVDDSGSMEREQEILATSMFTLINSLVAPLPTWEHEATDNLRVAIVSSNMGLQWDGNPFGAADGFPPEVLGEKCANPKGDNGVFKSDYDPVVGGSINLLPGVIDCEAFNPAAPQCPPGWTCQNPDSDGIGKCVPPSGDGTNQVCPPPPSANGSNYFSEASSLALSAACLSKLGTEGCGWEQQLVSAAVALETPGQAEAFMRPDALLVVLVISDEEDCSLKDGPAIFASDEVWNNDNVAVNTACGEHPEFLFTPSEIRDRLYEAKAAISGDAFAAAGVMFAAIVGVPPVDVCQGKGASLHYCLDEEAMQLNVIQNPSATAPQLIYNYACERFEGDEAVTQASPGRRYVELAQEYGSMSYVSSICNADWSPAMLQIADMISENTRGSCFGHRLDWDPETETPLCYAVVNVNGTACPPLPEGMAWLAEEQVGTEEEPRMACTIPNIAAPVACPAPGTPEFADMTNLMENGFGWFYCENEGEDFLDACSDGLDNDGVDGADCADPGCAECRNCAADGFGDAELCPRKCRYMVTFSDEALTQLRTGLTLHCRK